MSTGAPWVSPPFGAFREVNHLVEIGLSRAHREAGSILDRMLMTEAV
jgi:hypothetical protein